MQGHVLGLQALEGINAVAESHRFFVAQMTLSPGIFGAKLDLNKKITGTFSTVQAANGC